MLVIVVAAVLTVSVQDHLEGAEIGDATQFVAFKTGGRYYAERAEPSGRTVARGSWRIEGDRVDVKVKSCSGPSCGILGAPWSAQVEVHSEGAMTVRAESPSSPLTSGSYYCKMQGCEKRIGVELVAPGARADVLKALLAFLVEKNEARDAAVVWARAARVGPQPTTHVLWCGREGERAREGAAMVRDDLIELGWVDAPRVSAGPADCLYDVRVVIGDGVRPPS